MKSQAKIKRLLKREDIAFPFSTNYLDLIYKERSLKHRKHLAVHVGSSDKNQKIGFQNMLFPWSDYIKTESKAYSLRNLVKIKKSMQRWQLATWSVMNK